MIEERLQKSVLVSRVTELEWNFFSRVRNVGGPAPCQSQPDTFCLMRASQLQTWSPEILESYLEDLLQAAEEGRNPLSEKYAYMMESTSPLEYALIKDCLPAISAETMAEIRRIVDIHLTWEQTLRERYPRLRRRGRPMTAEQDEVCVTSVETYLLSELKTCSARTVHLLLAYTEQAQREGRNLAEENLTHMVRGYGYPDLAAAETALSW